MSINLYTIDRKLLHLQKKLNHFSLLHPTNEQEEKKKTLEDNTYNPQFIYTKHPYNLPYIATQLMRIRTDESIMGKLLRDKRNELLKKVLLFHTIGKSKFTSSSLNLYGKPPPELVTQAVACLTPTSEPSRKTLSAKIVKLKLHQALATYNLTNWKIKTKPITTLALFDGAHRTLILNTKESFHLDDVQRFIVHEIGTHLVRYHNGKKQKHTLFHAGFPQYLSTEEGLAVYNEERAGLLTKDLLSGYAARTIAVSLALTHSFSSVYTHLLDYFPPDEAWRITLRAKRGVNDTSKPGAFTKDYFYFKGWHEVKTFLSTGGNLRDLYIGKIGLQHTPYLPFIS